MNFKGLPRVFLFCYGCHFFQLLFSGKFFTIGAPQEKQVVTDVKSNAIIYARENQLVAVGAGQMSRVDSCRLAIEKATSKDSMRALGKRLAGVANGRKVGEALRHGFGCPEGLGDTKDGSFPVEAAQFVTLLRLDMELLEK